MTIMNILPRYNRVLFYFSALTFFGIYFKFFACENGSCGSIFRHCPLPISINFNFHTNLFVAAGSEVKNEKKWFEKG